MPFVGPSVSAIQRYEAQQDQIGHRVLYRYQIALGVPNGILLAISHVAAMTRDAATLPTKVQRDREIEKLHLMGAYLRNLSDRILRKPPKGKARLIAYEGLDPVDNNTWDELLLDLILSTQARMDPDAPTVFVDHAQLKELKRVDRARSENAQARHPNGRSSIRRDASQDSGRPSVKRLGALTQTNRKKKKSRKTGNTTLQKN